MTWSLYQPDQKKGDLQKESGMLLSILNTHTTNPFAHIYAPEVLTCSTLVHQLEKVTHRCVVSFKSRKKI